MSEKIMNSRIIHKHDTEENWKKATSFIPKQGELIVYDIDNSHTYERIKIGDGVTTVSNLAFATEEVDATLTQEGKSADAKAVGDAIKNISYNDLTDKPFGEVIKNDTLIINEDVFNTATEDQQFVWYVRISDTPIDISNFTNGATFVYDYGFTDKKSYDEILAQYIASGYIEIGAVMIIPHDNFTFGPHPDFTDMTVNKKGIYVGSTGMFTINGYGGFDDTIEVKQIDKKYIPEQKAVISYDNVDKLFDETYKFEDTVKINEYNGQTVVMYPTFHDTNEDTLTSNSYRYSSLPFLADQGICIYTEDVKEGGGATDTIVLQQAPNDTSFITETGLGNTLNNYATKTYVENAIKNSGGGGSVELDTTLTQEGKAADAKAVGDKIDTKVDKVEGKGLSTNDFTDQYKSNIDALIGPYSIGLSYNLSNDEYKVTGIGSCTDTDIIIPPIYNGKRVTSISESAFRDCTSLTSIIIPDSVTTIDYSAFRNCSALTSVTIGGSVTSIGYAAFQSCSTLTNVMIGNSVTSISDYAFYDCSALTSVTIPDSVTSIGSWAFYDCDALTSVTIGDSVTSIGVSAFANCSALTSVTIGDSVTTIGNFAFNGCYSLTIYCEAETKPTGWATTWNPDNRPAVWGVALDFAGVNSQLNELNNKSIDKIAEIDTWWDGMHSIAVDDVGIGWENEFYLATHDGLNASGPIYHKIPIVAGDNITFEVSTSESAEEEIVKINATAQTPITHSELVTLRDNSELVPGMFYRITDYICTTAQADTRAMNNKFDIIVQALSENTLSEIAKADYHVSDGTPTFKPEVLADNDGTLVENAIVAHYYIFDDFDEAGGDATKADYKDSDKFIAYGYLENYDGDVVPVIYKTDMVNAADNPEKYDSPDYEDTFYYIGTEVFDGVTYDKWRKINQVDDSDMDWQSHGSVHVLTNVVIGSGGSGVADRGYFKNSNLPAWEIKYCLDNDTTRFGWALADTIVGTWVFDDVLSIPEEMNDKPYPLSFFVNAPNGDVWTFNEMAFSSMGEVSFYTNGAGIDPAYSEGWQDKEYQTITITEEPSDTDFIAWLKANATKQSSNSSGKGVIYYMKDEHGNECPYDFKNIQFKRMISLENGYPELDEENGEEAWVYTFCATSYHIDHDEWSELKDGSLESPYGHMSDEKMSTFRNNIVGKYVELYDSGDEDYTKCGRQHLNNNVFFGYWEEIGSSSSEECPYYYAYCCGYNTLSSDCIGNTFGYGCQYNTLGDRCQRNNFEKCCSLNSFSYDCNDNTLQVGCSTTAFGYCCCNNILGEGCNMNTFGSACDSNTLGSSCSCNTFGDSCYSNTVGDWFSYNVFSKGCNHNTFGNSCTGNIFGCGCCYLAINGDYIRYIEVGSGVEGDVSNRLQITPEPNVNYQQIYRKSGSKEILI